MSQRRKKVARQGEAADRSRRGARHAGKALWAVPPAGVGALLYQFLSTPRFPRPQSMGSGVNGPLPSAWWWAGRAAALLLPCLLALRTRRVLGFFTGISLVLLATSVFLWQRSRGH